jgi:hypothetical protein
MDKLRDTVKRQLQEAIDLDKVQTGRGKNQEKMLGKLSDTRWNCRVKALRTLRDIFGAVVEFFETSEDEEALELASKMREFRFALILHLLIELLDATQTLSESLQSRKMNLLAAICLMQAARSTLSDLASDAGFNGVILKATNFCEVQGVDVPDLESIWEGEVKGRVNTLKASERDLSVKAYYSKHLNAAVLKAVARELDRRFNDDVLRVLGGAVALDPRDNFSQFQEDKLLALAREFYKRDFLNTDVRDLESELSRFPSFAAFHPTFQSAETFPAVVQALCEVQEQFPQLYRLAQLLIVLPITSASAERSFSALKLLKTRMRTSLGDAWLVDLLILYIEKEHSKALTVKEIAQVFTTRMNIQRRVV